MSAADYLDEEYELEHALALERARTSFLGFVLHCSPHLEINWHHRLLCDELDRLTSGDNKRLIVTCPPRVGKTEFLSRHYPAYRLGRLPDESIIATSYGQDLAQRNSRDVQRIMDSPAYKEVFPDSPLYGRNIRTVGGGSWLRNADIFEVVGKRGVYRAAGLGAGITGMGGSCLIIDDNLKNHEEAMSTTILEKQWEWYTSTFRTRLAKGGSIVILATRWSFDDIIGRLIALAESEPKADQWRVVKLPAINELGPSADDPRNVGEALWPNYFPVEDMEALRATDSRSFEALYQCNPVPLQGNIVQSDWWRFYQPAELPRRFERVILSCDLTFKGSSTGDWCVMLACGVHQGRCYVFDMVRRQMPFTEQQASLLRLYQDTAAKYGVREVLVEDAANGAALVDSLRTVVPSIIAMPAGQQSKAARAEAVTPVIEAGNVWLPDPATKAWVRIMLLEWAQFPMARHDDCVDSLVQALTRLFPNSRLSPATMPFALPKTMPVSPWRG